MAKAAHPKIVIVGRPNVGKSSLFNRIVGARKAIVESASGTTRDRLYADITRKGKAFTIVDTGGFEPTKSGDIPALVLKQLLVAIGEADIILFVTDGTAGVTGLDTEFASKLRKTSKKLYLVVNKLDDPSVASRAAEFFELGLGEPYAVSATNNIGVERLLDDVALSIAHPTSVGGASAVHVAIVGRPNVGKSSFVNAIFKEERVIVHPTPGTTRDAVDTDLDYKGRDYVLIDTAGIRHNTKLKESADFFGGVRSKEAIRRCDVAIVIIDGFDGLREDDTRIVETVIGEGKALIVAVNKWDLTERAEMAKYAAMLTKRMSALRHYPIVFMSCKTGRNVLACMDTVWSVYERNRKVLAPEELKKLLAALNGMSEVRAKRVKFHYLVQEHAKPPTFNLGVRDPKMVGENLKRYIEKFFRASHDYLGVPLRIRYMT